jgi:hypothetical protein
LAILTVGAAIPAIWHGLAGFFISAVFFGGTFLTVVTAVTSAPRRTLSPAHWTAAIAAVTAAFAVAAARPPARHRYTAYSGKPLVVDETSSR